MRMVTRIAICLLSAATASQVAAGAALPSTFTLGKLVPGDVWMYLHVVRNPEAEWIHAQWDDVYDALRKSGIEKDLMALIASVVPGDELDSVEGTIDRLTALIKRVRWSDS